MIKLWCSIIIFYSKPKIKITYTLIKFGNNLLITGYHVVWKDNACKKPKWSIILNTWKTLNLFEDMSKLNRTINTCLVLHRKIREYSIFFFITFSWYRWISWALYWCEYYHIDRNDGHDRHVFCQKTMYLILRMRHLF